MAASQTREARHTLRYPYRSVAYPLTGTLVRTSMKRVCVWWDIPKRPKICPTCAPFDRPACHRAGTSYVPLAVNSPYFRLKGSNASIYQPSPLLPSTRRHIQKFPISEISYPSIAHNVEIRADQAIAFGYNFIPCRSVMLCSLSVAAAAFANISLTAFSLSLSLGVGAPSPSLSSSLSNVGASWRYC
jgi:hypothetical protein